MKMFKDLKFTHTLLDSKKATLYFSNGYGVSVMSGSSYYTDKSHPYELAV